jgi:hypothetical protein
MASAYDKASLVMLPHATKEGKLYSVKPEDRSGDFTFSRGTSATRVNAYNTTLIEARIYPSSADGAAGGVGNVYIQDAQINQGLVATDYIETTTAAVYEGITDNLPRLDYSGGASCPSLLLEPSRTNGITSSEYFDGGSLTNTTISATYNTTDTLSPEGLYNAAKLTATGSFPRYYDFPTIGDNVDVSLSVFAKAGDASVFTIRGNDKSDTPFVVNFDLANGTAELSQFDALTPTFDIEPFGNGWYRCSVNTNSGSGATGFQIRPISHAQGETNGWAGSNYIYAYGVQYETSASYPTSYIPTYGTAVSRAGDAMNAVVPQLTNSGYTATLYVEFDGPLDPSATDAFRWYPNGDVLTRFWIYTAAAGIAGGGAFGFNINNPKHKFIFRVSDSTTRSIFYNGTKVVNTTGAAAGNGYDQIGIFDANANRGFNFSKMIGFNEALTDAEAIALTTI